MPYRELTGPQGVLLRHFWGTMAHEERNRQVAEALVEAFYSHKLM